MSSEATSDAHTDEVRRYFDLQSRTWSKQYESGLCSSRPERFVRALSVTVPAGGSVLDVGCGSGDITLEGAAQGWRMTGCDLSSLMLAEASAKPGAQAVSWVWLDRANRLPFEDGRFDAVYSSSVLEYVSDVAGHLSEVARVLRAGGQYAATVPDMRHVVRQKETSRLKIATCRPLMALLRRTRWAAQYEYLLTSLNRWATDRWVDLFKSAGLVPDAVPACGDPLLMLTARKGQAG